MKGAGALGKWVVPVPHVLAALRVSGRAGPQGEQGGCHGQAHRRFAGKCLNLLDEPTAEAAHPTPAVMPGVRQILDLSVLVATELSERGRQTPRGGGPSGRDASVWAMARQICANSSQSRTGLSLLE